MFAIVVILCYTIYGVLNNKERREIMFGKSKKERQLPLSIMNTGFTDIQIVFRCVPM